MKSAAPGRLYFNTDTQPQRDRFPVRETPSDVCADADRRRAIRMWSFGGEQQ